MNEVTQTDTHFIWLVDGRYNVQEAVLNKVIRLASVYQTPVTLVLDSRLRASERRYWFSFAGNEQLDAQWKVQQLEKMSAIENALSAASVDVTTQVLDNAYYLEAIKDSMKSECDNILIIQDEEVELRHPVFQDLVSLPCNAFILTDKSWPSNMKIVGAIDPLHENARPLDLDFRIEKKTKSLAHNLNADWHVMHACYVPPHCMEHKEKIKDIHEESLKEYGDTVDIPEKQLEMVPGMPEYAIKNWIEKNKGNLLVMGFVARNKIMAHLIGSTTIALLNRVPADMFLVKSTTE